MINRVKIERNEDGKVRFNGIDMGGLGEVVAENKEYIVVKFPAGRHWTGRGLPPSYHSPETIVLRKPDQPNGWHYPVIQWDNKRRA